MEWIVLKIKNLINRLNLSSWFCNCSIIKKSSRQQVNINTINITTNIYLPPGGEPSIEYASAQDPPKQQETKKTIQIRFTDKQLRLINKVNEVHRILGKYDYDFKEDYKWALYYIQYKPAEDWPYNAALRIAQAMQDIDFFSAFKEIKDPEKQETFNSIKSKLNYLYNRIIQELRHTDKRRQIERQFISQYYSVLEKRPVINYEEIFNDFENLLITLFDNFKLKL